MRVVHLVSGLMYGGGQKVAMDLVSRLSAQPNIDAQLWLLGCRYEVLRDRAAVVARYNGQYSSLRTLITTALRVRTHLASAHPDIIHSHGWDADVIAFLATWGRREARFVHLHVTPNWLNSRSFKHAARRMLTRLMFTGPRIRLVAVAEGVREHWARSMPQLAARTTVVLNSVDATVFHPPSVDRSQSGDCIRLGVACRLVAHKGLEILIRALPIVLQKTNTPVSLKIAGEGPKHAALAQLVEELGLNAHVEFCGRIEEMAPFYRTLDIFVLPAISDEGLPLAVLEAMATGLPVVASDVGGTREAIRHGVDGFVTTPGSANALAAAICELTTDGHRRRTMGRSAQLRADSVFSTEAQCSAVLEQYSIADQDSISGLRRLLKRPKSGSWVASQD